MPIFLYEARTQSGNIQEGRIEASSISVATGILQRKNLIVIDIQLQKSLAFFAKDLSLF